MSEPTDWHLVCITEKGRVSILKNLDLRTARETYKILLPGQRPVERKFPDCKECRKHGWSCGGGMYALSPDRDRLERVEAIGPEGEKLEPWFGVEPEIIDMTHLCRCGKAAKKRQAEDDNFGMPIPLTPFEKRALKEANA